MGLNLLLSAREAERQAGRKEVARGGQGTPRGLCGVGGGEGEGEGEEGGEVCTFAGGISLDALLIPPWVLLCAIGGVFAHGELR